MTSSGFAVLQDGDLLDYGLRCSVKNIQEGFCLDYSYIERAEDVAQQCLEVVNSHNPDLVAIEQTNIGRNRISQKKLEFVHFAVLTALKSFSSKVLYVDTATWRSSLKIATTKEDRKHNALVKKKKARGKITPKHRAVRWANNTYNLNLLLRDNDMADAIAVATFAWKRYSNMDEVNTMDCINSFFDKG